MGGLVSKCPTEIEKSFCLIVRMSGPSKQTRYWHRRSGTIRSGSATLDDFELDYLCMAYFLTMARIEGLSVREPLSPSRINERTDTLVSMLDK